MRQAKQNCNPADTNLTLTAVVLADWESTTPALGCGFLLSRRRKRSRSAVLSRSQVPSVRHLLNHQ
jgi:hypothetical protein